MPEAGGYRAIPEEMDKSVSSSIWQKLQRSLSFKLKNEKF